MSNSFRGIGFPTMVGRSAQSVDAVCDNIDEVVGVPLMVLWCCAQSSIP